MDSPEINVLPHEEFRLNFFGGRELGISQVRQLWLFFPGFCAISAIRGSLLAFLLLWVSFAISPPE
jgi:hypothetical protein